MPPVRNIVNDEPIKEKQVISSHEVGEMPRGIVEEKQPDIQLVDTRDLIMYENESGMMIPDALADLPLAIPNDLPEAVAGQITGPYVARAHSMSPAWERQKAAGCEEGDLYLACDATIEKCNPMGYFLISASPLYYARMKAREGIVVAATKDEDTMNRYNDGKERISWMKPHYVTICFVQIRDTLIPAKIDFFDTMVNAVGGAIRAVKQAYEPNWGLQSEAHKVALGAPTPLARVFHVARTFKDTSKSSGNTMYPGSVVSKPANIDQINLFLKSFKDPVFQRRLEQVKISFKDRVNTIEGVCS
jgi:hypothetical protein